MKINRLYVVWFVLIVAVIIAVIIYFSVYKKEKPVPVVEKPITTKEAAKSSLAWIDQQKDPADGLYYLFAKCIDSKCSQLIWNTKSWRETAYIIWGRYKYFDKTHDESQLAKIDSDIEALLKNNLQINTWNCKLMQELIVSESLPLNEKNLAQNLCFQGGYEGNEEETTTNDDVIDTVMTTIVNEKNAEIKGDATKLKTTFRRNAFVSADYLAIYKTRAYPSLNFPDGKKILVEDMSRNNFLKALYGYSLMSRNERTVADNSILGVAALDLYKFTNKSSYLDFAIFLESQNVTADASMGLEDIAYHGFFMKELSTIPGYEDSKLKLNKDIGIIINNKFDGSGFNGNKFDKGAFFEPVNNYYSSQINGLAVGVVSNL